MLVKCLKDPDEELLEMMLYDVLRRAGAFQDSEAASTESESTNSEQTTSCDSESDSTTNVPLTQQSPAPPLSPVDPCFRRIHALAALSAFSQQSARVSLNGLQMLLQIAAPLVTDSMKGGGCSKVLGVVEATSLLLAIANLGLQGRDVLPTLYLSGAFLLIF